MTTIEIMEMADTGQVISITVGDRNFGPGQINTAILVALMHLAADIKRLSGAKATPTETEGKSDG